MREIKFRCWNGETMVSPDYIDREGIAHWYENSIPESSKEPMQYTGLKDKNGVEIYEGDIVRYPKSSGYNKHITIASVEWEEERARFVARFRDYPEHHLSPILDRADHLRSYEVIGNINENPELLEDKR